MNVSDRVRITIIDGVADVVLTRPEKRNAFDDAMFAAITDASAALATDTSVQVVVPPGEAAARVLAQPRPRR
jgi:enoyl-CoA hydratase/carnithine racemase